MQVGLMRCPAVTDSVGYVPLSSITSYVKAMASDLSLARPEAMALTASRAPSALPLHRWKPRLTVVASPPLPHLCIS